MDSVLPFPTLKATLPKVAKAKSFTEEFQVLGNSVRLCGEMTHTWKGLLNNISIAAICCSRCCVTFCLFMRMQITLEGVKMTRKENKLIQLLFFSFVCFLCVRSRCGTEASSQLFQSGGGPMPLSRFIAGSHKEKNGQFKLTCQTNVRDFPSGTLLLF